MRAGYELFIFSLLRMITCQMPESEKLKRMRQETRIGRRDDVVIKHPKKRMSIQNVNFAVTHR